MLEDSGAIERMRNDRAANPGSERDAILKVIDMAAEAGSEPPNQAALIEGCQAFDVSKGRVLAALDLALKAGAVSRREFMASTRDWRRRTNIGYVRVQTTMGVSQ